MSTEGDDTTDQDWPGTTCASWLWVFATEYPQFEARKAIANLSKARIPPQASKDQKVNDVLRVVKAAGEIQKAVAEALSIAVTEAISRGATWRQVGEQLGIGKTGAHNKFAKGLSRDQESLLKDEFEAADLCDASWSGDEAEELLGFDREEWEAAPPYVAVQHVWRRTSKAYLLLKQSIMEMCEPGDGDWEVTFHRSYEQLRGAVRVILTPKYPKVIQECSRKLPISGPIDSSDSVATMLTQFGIRVVSAFLRVGEPARSDSREDQIDRLKNLLLAVCDLEQAVHFLTQPSSLEVIKLIEGEIYRQGDSVFLGEDVEESRSLVKFYDVYQRGDLEAISAHVGIKITSGSGITLEVVKEILKEEDD